jgi:hypothetical protein
MITTEGTFIFLDLEYGVVQVFISRKHTTIKMQFTLFICILFLSEVKWSGIIDRSNVTPDTVSNESSV